MGVLSSDYPYGSIGLAYRGILEEMISGQSLRTLLGKRIQFYRKQQKLSQAVLAEKADISITFLSQIERGIKYPTSETLSRIANSLGVEVCELFQEGEPPAEHRHLLMSFKNDVQKSVQKSVEAVFIKYVEENRSPSG